MPSTMFSPSPAGGRDLPGVLVPAARHDPERDARKAAQTRARAERAAARAAARAIPPQTDAAYAHLSLEDLRQARGLIAEEEDRLGYWQRILSTRQDAMRGEGADLDLDRLRPALSAGRLHSARSVITRLCHAELPALPELGLLWMDPEAPEAGAVLHRVAAELGAYRDALAALLRALTHELIARYRLEPTACLAVLPG